MLNEITYLFALTVLKSSRLIMIKVGYAHGFFYILIYIFY